MFRVIAPQQRASTSITTKATKLFAGNIAATPGCLQKAYLHLACVLYSSHLLHEPVTAWVVVVICLRPRGVVVLAEHIKGDIGHAVGALLSQQYDGCLHMEHPAAQQHWKVWEELMQPKLCPQTC
jgi:hypothetical protein